MTGPRGAHSAHLDAATIAAFVDRTLDPAARAAAEAHLAGCADCREVWVETSELANAEAEGAAVNAVDAPEVRTRSRRWMYGGAGMAFAAAIALAVFSPRLFDRGDRPELRELVEAVGTNRRTEARLTGGFKWGPVPSATRSGESSVLPPPAVDAAVAGLRLAAEANSTSISLAAVGTAYLTVGNHEQAIAALEEATTADPKNAKAWSDLAVAYLLRSHYPNRGADVPRAFEAVKRALDLESSLLEAQFNEALILQAMGLRPEAIEAWIRYLAAESDPNWRAEGQQRLDSLTSFTEGNSADAQGVREQIFDVLLPTWAAKHGHDHRAAAQALADARWLASSVAAVAPDEFAADVVGIFGPIATSPWLAATLSEGHLAYGKGRKSYRSDRYEAALSHFEHAERALGDARSPLRLSATLHKALVRYRQKRNDEAARILDDLLAELERHSYPSLNGRIKWARGLLLGLAGDRRNQVRLYREALDDFQLARESANTGSALGLLATALDRIGDINRSWDARLHALRLTEREGVLLAAAQSALRLRWFQVAETLQAAAAHRSRQSGRRPNLADALRLQAATASAAGNHERSHQLLEEARLVVAGTAGAALLAISTELDVTAAKIGGNDALAAAMRASRQLEASGSHARLPELDLARALALRRGGDLSAARDAAKAGLARYHTLRSGLPDREAAGFSDVMRSLLELAIEMEVEAGLPDHALLLLEQTRAAVVPGLPQIDSVEQIARHLSTNTVVVEYFVGPSALYTWGIDSAGLRHFSKQPMDRAALRRLILRSAPPHNDPRASDDLNKTLLAPLLHLLTAGDTIVFIADGPLHQLSFAALPTGDGQFLIERYALLMAPSGVLRPTTAVRDSSSIIAIGNPMFDDRVFPGLALLPYSEEEAISIAARYPGGVALTGSNASRSDVLNALKSGRAVHFAGHAVVNDLVPGESVLVVSGGGRDGISANEISRLPLSRTPLIVLAACESAEGFRTESEGPIGLARAFMTAGVPTILATRRNISDRSSRSVFIRFHDEWKRSRNAAKALQTAQVSAIKSATDPSREWAAVAVFANHQ